MRSFDGLAIFTPGKSGFPNKKGELFNISLLLFEPQNPGTNWSISMPLQTPISRVRNFDLLNFTTFLKIKSIFKRGKHCSLGERSKRHVPDC